jgi:hypothetical protein
MHQKATKALGFLEGAVVEAPYVCGYASLTRPFFTVLFVSLEKENSIRKRWHGHRPRPLLLNWKIDFRRSTFVVKHTLETYYT